MAQYQVQDSYFDKHDAHKHPCSGPPVYERCDYCGEKEYPFYLRNIDGKKVCDECFASEDNDFITYKNKV